MPALRFRRNTLRWPREGKYNRVQRQYPYPNRGEKGCLWTVTYTPRGRKILVPKVTR